MAAAKAELQVRGGGDFTLNGVLDFHSVAALCKTADGLLQVPEKDLRIDLAGVEHANSAGLALLIHWLREARQREQSLQFLNLPAQLQAMARVSGLEDFLAVPAK